MVNISEEELYQKYIIEDYSINGCAEYFKCSRWTIARLITKYNIEKDNKRKAHVDMVMTDEMCEVLQGAMLGDGSLLVQKNGVNAHLSYTSKSLQHVEFIANYFEEYKCGKGIYTFDVFDNRTEKIYRKNIFTTNSYPQLTKEMNKWYINKIKHIPNDLKLTPLVCLVWYIGDGGLSKRYDRYATQTITLATNCFNKEEIENVLLPQLSQFDARICKNGIGKNGEVHYQIKIYKKENIIKFLDYIGKCPFEDYSYKWDVLPSIAKDYSCYDNEWIELYNLNFPTTKIGLLYNCPSATVNRRLKLNNISIIDARNKGLFHPGLEWENRYFDGYSIDEIAKLYNCSSTIVHRYLKYIEINGNEEFLYNHYKKFKDDNELTA